MEPLGYVLSGASTSVFEFEVTRRGEAVLREGMFVLVETRDGELLARIDSIRVYSNFYKVGDLWSAARREGFQPPRDVAKYVVAEATVIGVLGDEGVKESSRPPEPGDPVILFDTSKPDMLKKLYGVKPGDPGIIWFGNLLGYENLPLALDVEALTMHLGVFGETGSGKSYGFGYLIELLSRIPVGDKLEAALPAIIVDANGDYLDYWLDYSNGIGVGEYQRVVRLVAPRSSARSHPYARLYTIDLDLFTARELAEFIVVYKAGGLDVNEMQIAALERALRDLRDEGYTYTKLLTKSVEAVAARLEELSRSRRLHHQTMRAAIAALEKFYEDLVLGHGIVASTPTLSRSFVNDIVSNPSLILIDFSAEGSPGIPLVVKQLIVAYLSRVLFTTFTEYKVKGREAYILYALEEAQNYAPNPRRYPISWSLARDYLSLIATQGRKFGICLAIISQRPVYVDPVIVSMLNTLIVYRLSVEDVDYISRIAGGLPKSLTAKLTRLPRGVALIIGQANKLGVPTLVKVGSRSTTHKMGYTSMVEALRRAVKRA